MVYNITVKREDVRAYLLERFYHAVSGDWGEIMARKNGGQNRVCCGFGVVIPRPLGKKRYEIFVEHSKTECFATGKVYDDDEFFARLANIPETLFTFRKYPFKRYGKAKKVVQAGLPLSAAEEVKHNYEVGASASQTVEQKTNEISPSASDVLDRDASELRALCDLFRSMRARLFVYGIDLTDAYKNLMRAKYTLAIRSTAVKKLEKNEGLDFPFGMDDEADERAEAEAIALEKEKGVM